MDISIKVTILHLTCIKASRIYLPRLSGLLSPNIVISRPFFRMLKPTKTTSTRINAPPLLSPEFREWHHKRKQMQSFLERLPRYRLSFCRGYRRFLAENLDTRICTDDILISRFCRFATKFATFQVTFSKSVRNV
jgi:hypothetical protein